MLPTLLFLYATSAAVLDECSDCTYDFDTGVDGWGSREPGRPIAWDTDMKAEGAGSLRVGGDEGQRVTGMKQLSTPVKPRVIEFHMAAGGGAEPAMSFRDSDQRMCFKLEVEGGELQFNFRRVVRRMEKRTFYKARLVVNWEARTVDLSLNNGQEKTFSMWDSGCHDGGLQWLMFFGNGWLDSLRMHATPPQAPAVTVDGVAVPGVPLSGEPNLMQGDVQLWDIPEQLRGGTAWLPSLIPQSSVLAFTCGKVAGCTFVLSFFHCPPCSMGRNGGYPALLTPLGIPAARCAPVFGQHRDRMASFALSLPYRSSYSLPATTFPVAFSVVFEVDGSVDFCPAPTHTGPHSPSSGPSAGPITCASSLCSP